MSAANLAALAASVAAMTVTTTAANAAVSAAAAVVTLPAGTRYTEAKVGTGTVAEAGRMVAVHYTGWLYADGMKGKKFDSSLDRGEPIMFQLGIGQVITGWDEGIAGMMPGGKRTLIIPPDAGYGERGAGADIPPGATLMFDVELVAVQ